LVDFSTSLEGILGRAKVCSQPVIRIRYDDFDSLVTALFPGTSYCITSTVEGVRDTYKTFHVDITTSSAWDSENRKTFTTVKADPFEEDSHLNGYLQGWRKRWTSENPDHFSPEPHDLLAYFLYRKLWEVDGKPIPKAMFLVEF